MNHNFEKVFYEELAKLLLEVFLPNDYQNLYVSDKPDLRMGETHGIEVTRAMYGGEGQASGIFQHIKLKNKDQVDQRYLRTLDNIGFELFVSDGIIGGYGPREAVWINDDVLRNTFIKKLSLAANYQLQTIDLFIYSPHSEWFEEDTIRGFMVWANNYSGSVFSKIIVFEAPYIYVYSNKNSCFRKVTIDENLYRHCLELAREIAYNEK